MEPFRTREPEAPVTHYDEPGATETKNVVNDTEHRGITSGGDFNESNPLENWEIQNGKYGLEYLGIKEIAKEFPLKMQFGEVDKYIKAEIRARGYDITPESWQKILSEMETEIGSSKLNAYERMKKLSEFVRIVKRFDEIKKKKAAFSSGL